MIKGKKVGKKEKRRFFVFLFCLLWCL